MMILILGQNSSGKSLYAEKTACAMAKRKLYYIATMIPHGQDGTERIARHRAQRTGKGFITIESPYADAAVDTKGTVLLEDMSNLLANLMFESGSLYPESTALSQINKLRDAAENLIIVSIHGLNTADGDNDETKAYICMLNHINQQLWSMADVVVEMTDHVPTFRKGENKWVQ